MSRGFLAVATILVMGWILTGHPLAALAPLWMYDRLPVALWLTGAGGAAAAGLIAARTFRNLPWSARPAAMVAVAILAGVLAMTVTADIWRHVKIARSGPDAVVQQSFLRSLRTAPREFQIDLHAVMLKQCVAYGWSYRTMAPYELPDSVRANVVPPMWFAPGTRCGPANGNSDQEADTDG